MSTDPRRAPRPWCLTTFGLLAACNGTTSYLDAGGRSGRAEATLGAWLTGTACVVVAAVCVALLAGMLRRRDARDAGTGRREVKSGLGWIYVGTAITVAVLLVAFGGTMATLRAASR